MAFRTSARVAGRLLLAVALIWAAAGASPNAAGEGVGERALLAEMERATDVLYEQLVARLEAAGRWPPRGATMDLRDEVVRLARIAEDLEERYRDDVRIDAPGGALYRLGRTLERLRFLAGPLNLGEPWMARLREVSALEGRIRERFAGALARARDERRRVEAPRGRGSEARRAKRAWAEVDRLLPSLKPFAEPLPHPPEEPPGGSGGEGEGETARGAGGAGPVGGAKDDDAAKSVSVGELPEPATTGVDDPELSVRPSESSWDRARAREARHRLWEFLVLAASLSEGDQVAWEEPSRRAEGRLVLRSARRADAAIRRADRALPEELRDAWRDARAPLRTVAIAVGARPLPL
jgi:hypothetical protein